MSVRLHPLFALALAAGCSKPAGEQGAAAPQGPTPGEGDFVAYRQPIPGSEVTFAMVPIPAGAFAMGSPPDEPGRDDDEGPQIEVSVDAFLERRLRLTDIARVNGAVLDRRPDRSASVAELLSADGIARDLARREIAALASGTRA